MKVIFILLFITMFIASCGPSGSGSSSSSSAVACTPPTLIQQASGATNSFTIPATGAGNLLVVGMYSSSPYVSSISDNAAGGGNSWVSTSLNGALAGSFQTEIWYVASSKAGATTITASGGTMHNYWFAEFSGLSGAPFVSGATLSNAGPSATPSGASVTTSSPCSIAFGVTLANGNLLSLDALSTWTAMPIISGNAAAYIITSSSFVGTLTPQWNQDSNQTIGSSTAIFH